MPLVVTDRVRETSTDTGTGALGLAGAFDPSFRTFVAAIGAGNTTFYAIKNEGAANEWEVGVGTISDGPPTLTRTSVLRGSSGAGVAVAFSAGTKDVFCTIPPEALYLWQQRLIGTTAPLEGGGDLTADRTLSFGTKSAGVFFAGPVSGAAAAPDFRAIDILDLPDAVVTQTELDATEFTVGLGLDLLYSEVHDSGSAVQSTSWDLPADTLVLGGTGIEIVIVGVAGAADQLAVTFAGTAVHLDAAGAPFDYDTGAHVEVRIRIMQPGSAPGSAVVWTDTFTSAPTPSTNNARRASYLAFDPEDDNTIAVSWGNAASRISAFQVHFLGGIPANPTADDGDTPGTPQPSAAGMPTIMVLRCRGANPAAFRNAAGSLGSQVDATDYNATPETGALTVGGIQANKWAEYKGKSYALFTLATTSHRIYDRPIGGTINTVAVNTDTFTVAFNSRTGLHVVGTQDGPILAYVFDGTGALKLTTFDGTTWSTTTLTGFAPSFPNMFGPGVCVVRGVMYVPLPNGTNDAGIAINILGRTVARIARPVASATCGMFASLYGRVFYMSGEKNGDSSGRTLYELEGGVLVARKVMTNGGTDTMATAHAACFFPISDSKLLCCFITNTGGTAANAFWTASTLEFDAVNDNDPAEVQVGSCLPAALTAAGGCKFQLFPLLIDGETDPGNAQIWLAWVDVGLSGNTFTNTWSFGKFQGTGTTMTGASLGVDPTNYALPMGAGEGGGTRIAPDDSADLIWDMGKLAGGSSANGLLTFKFTAQGTDTFKVKLFISTFENVTLMTQATLTGTATGSSAVRVGNEVQGCTSGTTHTVGVNLNGMGIGDNARLKLRLKAYRE